jgi:hypothetical protein
VQFEIDGVAIAEPNARALHLAEVALRQVLFAEAAPQVQTLIRHIPKFFEEEPHDSGVQN